MLGYNYLHRLHFLWPNRVAIGKIREEVRELLHCCFVAMLFISLLFSGYHTGSCLEWGDD